MVSLPVALVARQQQTFSKGPPLPEGPEQNGVMGLEGETGQVWVSLWKAGPHKD